MRHFEEIGRLTFHRSDIEQEVNGVYSFDRKEKLNSAKVKGMIGEAVQVFYDRVNK